MQRGIDAIRARREEIARCLTLEQGKPLSQARAEVDVAANMMQWYAEQARRAYGRIVPGSAANTNFEVRKEPVGPCLLLSPSNMPIVLAARKIPGALSSGCSCIVKPPEETPLPWPWIWTACKRLNCLRGLSTSSSAFRPWCPSSSLVCGLAGSGEPGAYHALELMKRELDTGLALIGCPSIKELDESFIVGQ